MNINNSLLAIGSASKQWLSTTVAEGYEERNLPPEGIAVRSKRRISLNLPYIGQYSYPPPYLGIQNPENGSKV